MKECSGHSNGQLNETKKYQRVVEIVKILFQVTEIHLGMIFLVWSLCLRASGQQEKDSTFPPCLVCGIRFFQTYAASSKKNLLCAKGFTGVLRKMA